MFDLCLIEENYARAGKSLDYLDVRIVLEKLHSGKAGVLNIPPERCFRDRLVWTVGLIVEIKCILNSSGV